MIFTSDAEIVVIGTGLLDRTLPKPAWKHEAHLAAALWIIRTRPDLDAERDLPGIIRAYNEATGVPNSDTRGYHHTITLASLRAIRAVMAGLPADLPLFEICNALIASPYGDKRWPLNFWREAAVFSPAARHGWVEPDVRALPF